MQSFLESLAISIALSTVVVPDNHKGHPARPPKHASLVRCSSDPSHGRAQRKTRSRRQRFLQDTLSLDREFAALDPVSVHNASQPQRRTSEEILPSIFDGPSPCLCSNAAQPFRRESLEPDHKESALRVLEGLEDLDLLDEEEEEEDIHHNSKSHSFSSSSSSSSSYTRVTHTLPPFSRRWKSAV